MSLVDLSPDPWAAPGWAQLNLQILLSAVALPVEPLPLNEWLNSFSPTSVDTVNWVSGLNEVTIPDTVNARYLIVQLPSTNTQTVQFDSNVGHYLNPKGVIIWPFDPNHAYSPVGFFTGGIINGVRVIIL